MNPTVKNWCLSFLLITTCLFSLHAQASSGALHDANSLRVLLDRVNTDYQMFKGENANPKYGDALEEDLELLADARSDFLDRAAELDRSAAADEIDANVERYISILSETYEELSNGGFEAAVAAGDMIESKLAAQKAITALYLSIAETSKVDPRVIEYQIMSYEMQQIAAKYLENAAATYGVAYRDQSDEKTIDQLAQEFALRLDGLNLKAADLPPGVKVELADVKRKWSFIQQSLLNYMENQVSFLVYLYSRKIVDGLLSASEHLALATGGDTTTGAPTIAPPADSGIQLPPGIPAAQ